MKRFFIFSLLFLSVLGLAAIPASRVLGIKNASTGTPRYIDYSPQSFASESKNTRAICFLADWCEYCQNVDSEIRSSGKRIPANSVIFKADYEKEVELKKKYSIDVKHECLIFDHQDNVINRVAPDKILSTLGLQ